MSIDIDADAFLESSRLPIVDVRAPGEFQKGHITTANNVPLLDDAERAEVGTLYKKSGTESAVARGRELVGQKIDQLLDSVKAVVPGPELIVHCWRGGLRSEGFAGLLQENGFQPRRLRGGYKAFRQTVHTCFTHPRRIIILSGRSGAGKTRLLGSLRDSGEQVVDLEHLASHRGSVFGGINLPPQPSVEQFENDLFEQWKTLDPNKPVWIECESQSIGRVFIPHGVWRQMLVAPAIFIEVALEQRVQFLVEEYGDLPAGELSAAINKISKRLGGLRLQKALDALERGNTHSFAAIALEYYDKAYGNSQRKYPRAVMASLPLESPGQADAVDRLRQMADELTN